MLAAGRDVAQDLPNSKQEARHVPHDLIADAEVLAMVGPNFPPKLR